MVDQFDSDASGKGAVVRFPQSRVRPAGGEAANQLGSSLLAQKFGVPERQLTGHWCSHCRGIWYGYLLEVACPICGNRHG